MNETLESLYRHLYEQNCIAAEDDYLEYFEAEFGPGNTLSGEMTEEGLISALRSLVAELVNDTGDEELVKEWATEGGADGELIAILDLV